MSSYLETCYAQAEYAPDSYAQRFTDHLVESVIAPALGDLAGKSVLDVGSGRGNHLVGFARHGMLAYGLDKRKECLDALEQFEIRSCDIEHDPFPFSSGSFDLVFSKSVIEHVWHADNFLREVVRVLRPGGLALIMTPDWKSQAASFWDDYTHVKPWTRKGLQNALHINGLDEVECRYFLQLPLVWKHPRLTPFVRLLRFLPYSWRFTDAAETQSRTFLRFAQERMLLATARKP